MIEGFPTFHEAICENCNKEIEEGTFVDYIDRNGVLHYSCIDCFNKIDCKKIERSESLLNKKDEEVLIYQLWKRDEESGYWYYTLAKLITNDEFYSRRRWFGSDKCDVCQKPILHKLYDVQTKEGPWMTLCPECNEKHARVILKKSKTGVGQVYENCQEPKGDVAFLKIM